MEVVGAKAVRAFFDEKSEIRKAKASAVRKGGGHPVKSFFELAKKVAEIQFMNRDLHFLFRGQTEDHKTKKRGASLLKAEIFRLNAHKPHNAKNRVPSPGDMTVRFELLGRMERELVAGYEKAKLPGIERLKRYRAVRWAILQHYDVCATPLLDVTQSLRVATSFAMLNNETKEAFLFVFGVPNISGATTASSEAGLQILRLASVCPPDAVRPHLQEGYLLGAYPDLSDLDDRDPHEYHELDFGRRLVAKFRFNPSDLSNDDRFVRLKEADLYPKSDDDLLRKICADLGSNAKGNRA